jgi:two-component sensor histidine kinase
MLGTIRRYLFVRLLAAIFATGILTGLGCVTAGVLLARSSMENSIRASVAEADRRFRILDVIVSKVLEDRREQGRVALEALARRYPGVAEASAASPAELKAAALELGVSEAYFIGADLGVFATSFPPDQGLSFAGGAFGDYLESVMLSGAYTDQGISLSTVTKSINFYQYYGRPDAGMIVEVSRGIQSLVAEAYPGFDYGSLATFVCGGCQAAESGNPVSIEDYLDRQGVSFLWERKVDETIPARIATAEASGGELVWREGGKRMILKRLGVEMSDSREDLYLHLSVDEAPFRTYVASSLVAAFLSMAAMGALAYAGARRSLGTRIVSRLEAMAGAMERVGKGEGTEILDDGVGDELSAIGRVAADMVSTIRRDTAELRALTRRLELEAEERERRREELQASLDANVDLLREVNHRVKNNLQIVGSLARLEADAATSPAAAEVLGKMETRILGMALIEDQLLRNPSLRRIDMDELLAELCGGLIQNFPGLRGRVALRIEARGVRLEAEDAIALALAGRELCENCLRHAFPGGMSGTISVELSSRDSGGCTLLVWDNGTGIPEGGLAEGLGFSIARAVVAQRGGMVGIEAPPGGRGLLVRVRLGA